MPQYGPNVPCVHCGKTIWPDYKREPAPAGGWLHVRCARKLAKEQKDAA